jgi:hypothetical protein
MSEFPWERRPSLPAYFGQSAIVGSKQAGMGGAAREFPQEIEAWKKTMTCMKWRS